MSEVTKYFEQAISRWLDKEKANDELFADQVKASGKTVEGCCNYIIQRVRESKQCGYSDDEIYGMARHFFDEDSEKNPGKQDVQRIVVSGHIELSESEKAELKRQAEKEYLRQLQEEAKKRETAQRSPVLSNSSNNGKSSWSEEDKRIIDNLISQLGNLFTRKLIKEETKDKYVNWLKSIKDRVQLKQDWSKEDERLCQCLIKDQEEALDNVRNDKYGHSEIISDLKEMYNERIAWLKSLRPQSHWKPNDEQMIAIDTAINVLGKGTLNGKQLIELQEELQKLRKE